MTNKLFYFTFISIFSLLVKTEKVSLYYLSPLTEIEDEGYNKYTNTTKEIPIEMVGENADFYDDKEIMGYGQEINNCKLEQNQMYVFTKVSEKECQDTPFYYNKEDDVSFYFDNCKPYEYTCDDGYTVISSDSQNLHNIRKNTKQACEFIMKTQNKLTKRCTKTDYFSISKSLAEAGMSTIMTIVLSGGTFTASTFAGLIAASAMSGFNLLNCSNNNIDEDVCCKIVHIRIRRVLRRKQKCIELW
ncbi:hypothetical protein PIROE2DRAFT_14621 [Piromyces sp. E2]|nr:hypothetical protein PIROE2DRAFT_14621 [Piromyces sp. E2]|eukprot:OUM59784.1 hypothetical protein PIROE2DRAFT_14621 [Piromyces sp. E2]